MKEYKIEFYDSKPAKQKASTYDFKDGFIIFYNKSEPIISVDSTNISRVTIDAENTN